MALQFFSVHSEALAFTHDALLAHANALGLRAPGPTRALRIAQLYGHIQLRAAGRPVVSLAVCELAACWRLQPRQLRQDLALLQELGWLTATGTSRGTVIALHPLEATPDPRVVQGSIPRLTLAEPLPRRQHHKAATATDPRQHSLPVVATSVSPIEGEAVVGGGSEALTAREMATDTSAGPSLGEEAATDSSPPVCVVPVSTATAAEPSPAKTRCQVVADLLVRLAEIYNQHRPASWPAYHPRGNGLRAKVRQALQHAGGSEALMATFIAALTAMPPFWRTTYPQGRSGAECMAVLFATDRGCAGLGVEFWHLFSWAQAGSPAGRNRGACGASCAIAGGSGGSTLAADGAPATPSQPEDPLQRARRLFLWDSGVWRGQGREALLLSLQEKRELTLLLEADGVGLAGTAARQFAPPDELVAGTEAEDCGGGEAQVCGRGEGAGSVPAAPPGASGDPIPPSSQPSQQASRPDGDLGRKRKPPHQKPVAGLRQEPQPDANPSSKPQPIKRTTTWLQPVQPKRPLPPPASGPPSHASRRRSASRHLQGSQPAVNARAG